MTRLQFTVTTLNESERRPVCDLFFCVFAEHHHGDGQANHTSDSNQRRGTQQKKKKKKKKKRIAHKTVSRWVLLCHLWPDGGDSCGNRIVVVAANGRLLLRAFFLPVVSHRAPSV